jgi:hypothetical protein
MCEKITPEEHFARFNERKAAHDYNAIFRYGCCYHFALALHRRYGFSLEYVPSERHPDDEPPSPGPPGIGHCWAVHRSGRAIDINGMLPKSVIREIYRERCELPTRSVEPEALQAALDSRGYPPAMNADAFALANAILDSHARFQGIGDDPKDIWDPGSGK